MLLQDSAYEALSVEEKWVAVRLASAIGRVENPANDPVPLCRGCAEDHHAYWDEMWADANRDRL